MTNKKRNLSAVDEPTLDINSSYTESSLKCITFNDNNNDTNNDNTSVVVEVQSNSKKVKSLPVGYVCRACGEIDKHAIYDCPSKIKKPKQTTDNISKNEIKITIGDVAESDTDSKHHKNDLGSKHNNTTTTTTTNDSSVNKAIKDNKYTVFISGLPFKIKKTEILHFFKDENIGNDILPGRDIRLVCFEDKPDKCKGIISYVIFKTFIL